LILGPSDSHVAEPITVEVTHARNCRAEKVAIGFAGQDCARVRGLNVTTERSVKDIGFARADTGEELIRSNDHISNTVAVNVVTRGHGPTKVVIQGLAKKMMIFIFRL
jgi:hypothetical protein